MSQREIVDPSKHTSEPPLLERDRELALFEEALDRLADGVGSLLLVEGPAGIGKTRLLAEATELARNRKFLVRAARGGELEREMPFGVARQLLESVIERASEEERASLLSGSARLALLALSDNDREDATPTDALAPLHGLHWLVANLADARPLLLAIDDLHWADAQTLRFIDYLARRLADLPAAPASRASWRRSGRFASKPISSTPQRSPLPPSAN
ncbi:MAG: AAA family ATPase [Actinomycetota bacterium]